MKGQLCPYCGKAAWFWKREPIKGEKVDASFVEALPGKEKPINGSPYLCQHCGEKMPEWIALNPEYMKDFEEDGTIQIFELK